VDGLVRVLSEGVRVIEAAFAQPPPPVGMPGSSEPMMVVRTLRELAASRTHRWRLQRKIPTAC